MADNKLKGILGNKLGMTQVFDENNRIVPVTVVQVGPCVVTQVRTVETDGYSAVQLAFGAVDPRRVTKPIAGQFVKADTTPRRHLVELRMADVSDYEVGQELTADLFADGAVVDVVGTSKGKGYAGVMKRHGFKGLGAGHGVKRVTTQNLTVHRVDAEAGLLLIKGAVPGRKGGLVLVKSAVKGGAL